MRKFILFGRKTILTRLFRPPLRFILMGLFFGLLPAPVQAQCTVFIGAVPFATIQAAVNAANVTGATVFVKNGKKGVSCDVGAYVSGRKGTLDGNKGPIGIGEGCVNNLNN
jgi:hypothetical protein